jgi:LAS superfamily LD-carboxypeptidase LdcB
MACYQARLTSSQNPNSDHNTGLAVDLTHDPHNGIDCGDIYEKLKA